MKFNYKIIGISLALLSSIVNTEGVLFPIEILDRNQFRCGKTKSKNLCSKSSIERKKKLKEVKDEKTTRIADNGAGTVKTTIINKTIDQDGEVSTNKIESISKY